MRSIRKWRYALALSVMALLLAAWTHGTTQQPGNLLTDPANGNLLTDPANGNLLTR